MKISACAAACWTPPLLVPLGLAIIVLAVALMRALH
jgi:hypothetical protein